MKTTTQWAIDCIKGQALRDSAAGFKNEAQSLRATGQVSPTRSLAECLELVHAAMIEQAQDLETR